MPRKSPRRDSKRAPAAPACSGCLRRGPPGTDGRIVDTAEKPEARLEACACGARMLRVPSAPFAARWEMLTHFRSLARSREFESRLHCASKRKGPITGALAVLYGARGETRTRTMSPSVDFESTASANSATRARRGLSYHTARGYTARISTSSTVRRISSPAHPRPSTDASPTWLSNGSQRTPSQAGASSAWKREFATMRHGSRLPK